MERWEEEGKMRRRDRKGERGEEMMRRDEGWMTESREMEDERAE